MAFDSSGSWLGMASCLQGGPQWVTGRLGERTCQFDGSDDCVETNCGDDLAQWTVMHVGSRVRRGFDRAGRPGGRPVNIASSQHTMAVASSEYHTNNTVELSRRASGAKINATLAIGDAAGWNRTGARTSWCHVTATVV